MVQEKDTVVQQQTSSPGLGTLGSESSVNRHHQLCPQGSGLEKQPCVKVSPTGMTGDHTTRTRESAQSGAYWPNLRGFQWQKK